MDVLTYIEKHNVSDYVVTNRERTPIPTDELKYLDLRTLTVVITEMKKGVLHIFTNYMGDAC